MCRRRLQRDLDDPALSIASADSAEQHVGARLAVRRRRDRTDLGVRQPSRSSAQGPTYLCLWRTGGFPCNYPSPLPPFPPARPVPALFLLYLAFIPSAAPSSAFYSSPLVLSLLLQGYWDELGMFHPTFENSEHTEVKKVLPTQTEVPQAQVTCH